MYITLCCTHDTHVSVFVYTRPTCPCVCVHTTHTVFVYTRHTHTNTRALYVFVPTLALVTAICQFVNWMHCATDPDTLTRVKELLEFMKLVQTDSWPRCSGSGCKMRSGGKKVGDLVVGLMRSGGRRVGDLVVGLGSAGYFMWTGCIALP